MRDIALVRPTDRVGTAAEHISVLCARFQGRKEGRWQ